MFVRRHRAVLKTNENRNIINTPYICSNRIFKYLDHETPQFKKKSTSKWIGKIGNIVTLLNLLLKTVYFKQFRGRKSRIYEEHFYGDNYFFCSFNEKNKFFVKKEKIMKLKPKRRRNANAL